MHCAVDGYAKLVSLREEVSRKATLANRKLEEMKHNMMNAIRKIKYAFIVWQKAYYILLSGLSSLKNHMYRVVSLLYKNGKWIDINNITIS